MEGSPILQRYARQEIGKDMIRAGLDNDNPIRQILEDYAVIDGPPGEGSLRWRAPRGELISIEAAIKQLRADPNCSQYFPDRPKISRNNLDQIRDNFDRIARGEVEVIK